MVASLSTPRRPYSNAQLLGGRLWVAFIAVALPAAVLSCQGSPEAKIKRAQDGGKGTSYGTAARAELSGGNWVHVGAAESHHPYGNRENQAWRFNGEAGTDKMTVRFDEAFDLESGYDFVEIYDATGLQVVPALTGQVPPADIEVSGSFVEIKLVTDRSVVRHGFLAEVYAHVPCICPTVWAPVCGVDGKTYGNSCNATCEGVETFALGTCEDLWMTVPSREQSSHPYSNNTERQWTFSEGGATKMRLHFSKIEVEKNYDYLYVLDGSDRIVAMYTGEYLDEYSPVVAGDTIKLQLKSDYSVTGYGFEVDHYQVMGGCYSDAQCPISQQCVQVQCIRAPCFKQCIANENSCVAGYDTCGRDDYCSFADTHGGGSCGGDGTVNVGSCEARCDTSRVRLAFTPVCGCDDRFYANPCNASAHGIDVQYLGTCGTPHCGDIGRDSEGWFNQGESIATAACAGAWAVCGNVGTVNEGWVRSDTGASIMLAKCSADEGESCSGLQPCGSGLSCEQGSCVDTTPSVDCQPSGCSGQVCSDHPVITTCEFRPHYACYRDAACEVQENDRCAWTSTPSLQLCLDRHLGSGEGGMCGSIMGLVCQVGLVCDGMPDGVADGAGTCRRPCTQGSADCGADALCDVRSGGDDAGACAQLFESQDTPLSVPDNDAGGISSTLTVLAVGTASSARLSLDIDHSFRGDLTVTLTHPDGRAVILHDRAGGSADDLHLVDYELGDEMLTGMADGAWTLSVVDHAQWDTGSLRSWRLEF